MSSHPYPRWPTAPRWASSLGLIPKRPPTAFHPAAPRTPQIRSHADTTALAMKQTPSAHQTTSRPRQPPPSTQQRMFSCELTAVPREQLTAQQTSLQASQSTLQIPSARGPPQRGGNLTGARVRVHPTASTGCTRPGNDHTLTQHNAPNIQLSRKINTPTPSLQHEQ